MQSIPPATSQAVNKLPGADSIRHSFVFPAQTTKNTTPSEFSIGWTVTISNAAKAAYAAADKAAAQWFVEAP